MRSRFNRVKDWTELAVASHYSARRLAKRCNASLRQLERFFLQVKGQTPHHWLNDLRQQKALELLRTGWTPKEVAAHLWYSQVTNFARDFKRCHGVPPAEIQDALAQNVAF